MKQSLLTECTRLNARYSNYHLHHLTLSTKNTDTDSTLLKRIVKAWRSFCDVQCIRFLCYDSDGTEHLHVAIWSELEFRTEFYPKFQLDSLQLEADSNAWKSRAKNKYSEVCLSPHNSASRLFEYILSERNLRLDYLKQSDRHFYAASRGVDTSRLNRLFKEFYALSDSVRRAPDQLGIILSKSPMPQPLAESVKSFLKSTFSIFCVAAPGRSKEINNAKHRSRIPLVEKWRHWYLFDRFEYSPTPAHIISKVLSKWTSYSSGFQARLIPKLLYDGMCHLWARNAALSLPPAPLDDFYSDDFLCLGSRDLSLMEHRCVRSP